MVTPVHIIAGFLGSGKTTLLARMLEATAGDGRKTAVIMNEAGDVNLEALLFDDNIPMKEMLGGCICCTIRGDVAVQIQELMSEHHPDVIFIESTGVANPMEILDAVTEASLFLPVELQSVITVVDGAHTADLLGKPENRTLRLMRDGVRCASHIILNKVDRMNAAAIEEVEGKLREWNPSAPITQAVRCDVDYEKVLDGSNPPVMSDHTHDEHCNHSAHVHHSHEHVSVYTHFLSGPVDSHAFESFIRGLPEGVYRAKGVVTFTDTASRFLFQYAYREIDFIRITPQGHVNDVAVFIGEHFSKTMIKERLERLENEAGVTD